MEGSAISVCKSNPARKREFSVISGAFASHFVVIIYPFCSVKRPPFVSGSHHFNIPASSQRLIIILPRFRSPRPRLDKCRTKNGYCDATDGSLNGTESLQKWNVYTVGIGIYVKVRTENDNLCFSIKSFKL